MIVQALTSEYPYNVLQDIKVECLTV